MAEPLPLADAIRACQAVAARYAVEDSAPEPESADAYVMDALPGHGWPRRPVRVQRGTVTVQARAGSCVVAVPGLALLWHAGTPQPLDPDDAARLTAPPVRRALAAAGLVLVRVDEQEAHP